MRYAAALKQQGNHPGAEETSRCASAYAAVIAPRQNPRRVVPEKHQHSVCRCRGEPQKLSALRSVDVDRCDIEQWNVRPVTPTKKRPNSVSIPCPCVCDGCSTREKTMRPREPLHGNASSTTGRMRPSEVFPSPVTGKRGDRIQQPVSTSGCSQVRCIEARVYLTPPAHTEIFLAINL